MDCFSASQESPEGVGWRQAPGDQQTNGSHAAWDIRPSARHHGAEGRRASGNYDIWIVARPRLGRCTPRPAALCGMLRWNEKLNGPKGLTRRLEENGVMKRDATDILRDALDLPPEARAALAGSLLDSLDQTVDEDAESAWEEEIMTRLKELDQGRVQLVPWVEARRRITGR